MRTVGCSILHCEIRGWSATTLCNDSIAVTVLPGKGADIYRFVHIESGVDVLCKTPWGLQPPGSPPRAGSADDVFLHNYEGAWQELLPNTFRPCQYRGLQIPLHGEVATLPWDLRTEHESLDRVEISLQVRCRLLPLRLVRRMRLTADSPTLTIEETVHNDSEEPLEFVWGHHPVLGAPFLEEGCIIEMGPCTVCTPNEPYEVASASLVPGQRTGWPHVLRLGGGTTDLRMVSGASAGTHDHAYLTEFERGLVEVKNPRLGLLFSLEWDPSVFRWMINWRPFGGSHLPPLEGIYGMGVELWAAGSNLADAVESHQALRLEARGILQTSLRATLQRTTRRLGT